MLNIVYPYVASEWEELRYSLRSLEQYLQEDFRVYILGDYKPSWITNVNYIETTRFLNPHEDTGNKLKICADLLETFLWMSDDIFLLKPVTLKDLKKQKVLKEKPIRPLNVQTTVKLLQTFSYGHKIYNYGNHTPRYYESSKLKQMAKKWPIFDGSLSPELLYFNIYGNINPEILDDRLFVQSPGPITIKPHHRFLNINETGLTEELKRYLAYRFDKQSQFELTTEQEKIIPPKLKLKTYTPDGVWIKYKGKKKNFKYDVYDFSNGPVIVPKQHAEVMVTEYPKTFGYGQK